jgi:hypothetical protein
VTADPLGHHVACHARESGHPVFAAALDSRLRGNDEGTLIRPVSPATFSRTEKGSALIRRFGPPPGLRPGRLFSQREAQTLIRRFAPPSPEGEG